jgi:hypothetical protein
MPYRIKKMKRKGIDRWAVLQGTKEIARFYLKRHAITWILQQEERDAIAHSFNPIPPATPRENS